MKFPKCSNKLLLRSLIWQLKVITDSRGERKRTRKRRLDSGVRMKGGERGGEPSGERRQKEQGKGERIEDKGAKGADKGRQEGERNRLFSLILFSCPLVFSLLPGLRTIGIAYADVGDQNDWTEAPERNMILIGITGIKDPVRKEVPKAVADCKGE